MKWYGKIGFVETVDTGYGVYEPQTTERIYYGDVERDTHRNAQESNKLNDNVTIDNQLSILMDLYASRKMGYMKWIEFMGIKWKVKSIQVQYPRLIVSLGEVYNG